MAISPRIRRVALISLVSLLGLVAVAWFARNVIATTVVRSVASRLLGVNVAVDAVRLDPFGLKVEVEGLVVDNPPNWGAPHALQAGLIQLAVSGDTTSSHLVVDRIGLKDVTVWFIQDGMKSNVSQLVDNLSAKEAKDEPKEKPAPADGTDLLIRLLELDNVSVRYADRAGAAKEVPVLATLNHVEVKDIHGKTAGKDLAEQLVGQVFEATMLAIVSDSGGKLPATLGKGIGSSIEAGGRLGKSALESFDKATKGAGEAVGGLINGLGDAFGGKKPSGTPPKGR